MKKITIIRMCIAILVFSQNIDFTYAQSSKPAHYYRKLYITTNIEFNDFTCKKFMFIYSKAELASMISPINGSISLDNIWFRCIGPTTNPNSPFTETLTNFTIKIGHTNLSPANINYTFANNFNVGSPVTVFTANTLSQTFNNARLVQTTYVDSNWTAFNFTTPFVYDGVSNIVVQIDYSSCSVSNILFEHNNDGQMIYAEVQNDLNALPENPLVKIGKPNIGFNKIGGCTSTSPVFSLGSDVSTCNGLSTTLTAPFSSDFTYTWSTGATNNTITTTTPCTYWCEIKNNCGAIFRDSINVSFTGNSSIPLNAFTPNGDGINDKWIVAGNSTCFKTTDVIVFNRYGSTVFKKENYTNDWLGTYGNKPLPDGTYYYVVTYHLLDGRKQMEKGNVTILR